MKLLAVLMALPGLVIAGQTTTVAPKSRPATDARQSTSAQATDRDVSRLPTAQRSQPAPAVTAPQQKKVHRKLADGRLIVAGELKVTLTENAARVLSRDAGGARKAVALPALLHLHPDISSVETRHTSARNWIKGDEIPARVRPADGTIPRIARNFTAVLRPGADAVTVRETLQKHPDVQRVDLKTVNDLHVAPNDTSYGQQWAPPIIGLEGAWEVPGRGPVRVAVIDTGVLLTHPEFESRIVFEDGYADWDNGSAPGASGTGFDHGTHVAGIICALRNNSRGVAGYSNDIELMSMGCATWNSDQNRWLVGNADDAMDDAVANGAKIINCSFGFGDEIEDEVEDAYDHGVIVVHGVGNVPVSIEGHWETDSIALLSVTATKSDGAATPTDVFETLYSFGPGVDLAAPGTNIFSTVPSGYGWKSGTSMAAPQVSGAAALVMSMNPTLVPAGAARHLLLRMAQDKGLVGWDEQYGYGALRVKKDVLQAVRDAGTFVSSASPYDEAGTYDNPWRSIPAALSAAPDGTVLVLNAGIVTVPSYNYPPVTITKPCTLTAIPDRPVVIGQ